jgi:hypothetical protein
MLSINVAREFINRYHVDVHCLNKSLLQQGTFWEEQAPPFMKFKASGMKKGSFHAHRSY